MRRQHLLRSVSLHAMTRSLAEMHRHDTGEEKAAYWKELQTTFNHALTRAGLYLGLNMNSKGK